MRQFLESKFEKFNLLHVFALSSDWFIELSTPVVIGQSNCFGFGFTTLV